MHLIHSIFHKIAYLARECVPMYLMLRALLVLRTVVDINLLELISVCQGPSGYIYMLFSVFIHPEHQRLSGIVEGATNLRSKKRKKRDI